MGTRVVNLTPLVASLRLRVPDRYSFSDLFIDGEKRLSFKGRTSIQSKLPPGVYTLHVVSDNAESESRTMNLKGGQSTEVYFQRFTQRERLFDRVSS